MTLVGPRGDMGRGESSDMGNWLSLKWTCDNGNPLSRAQIMVASLFVTCSGKQEGKSHRDTCKAPFSDPAPIGTMHLSPYSIGNWVCVGCPTPTKLT